MVNNGEHFVDLTIWVYIMSRQINHRMFMYEWIKYVIIVGITSYLFIGRIQVYFVFKTFTRITYVQNIADIFVDKCKILANFCDMIKYIVTIYMSFFRIIFTLEICLEICFKWHVIIVNIFFMYPSNFMCVYI